ncbi:MAG: hypothetical protein KatS3mg051_1397 [Anaerolineae bacterium]|nr:MAG: hypothetical protein KatS3mg051_1397 [Anaerolineae bacterium]
MDEQTAYHELQAYSITHGDPAFIHQHVVDAWTLQHADEHTKPIAITFALVGLYLHCERGYTGKQVQRVHVLMARRKQTWPTFALPCERGTMTVQDVMKHPPGPARDQAIEAWCALVWAAYCHCRESVRRLLGEHRIG